MNLRTYIVFGITLIINLYTSTILPIGDIGIFNVVTNFVMLFSLFIIFGFSNTISKYLPKLESQNQKKEANATVYLSLVFNCGLALLIGIILIVFSEYFSVILFPSEAAKILSIYLGILVILIPNEIMGQAFIVRYNFGRYLIPFFTADIIAIVSKIYFLIVLQNIDAFFYSAIISETIKFVILFIEILITFGRPTFSFSFTILPITFSAIVTTSLTIFFSASA